MSHEPIARQAMRDAERGARADASRLVDAVPALMREARRRAAAGVESPTLTQLANWALPRLAAVTAVAVIAATTVVVWERDTTSTKTTTFESVILDGGGDGTGDVVFDALLGAGRNDG